MQSAIDLHQGDNLPGFPSIDSFLYLLMPALEDLIEPANECLNNVFNFLEELANDILDRQFQRFPSLLPDIKDIVRNLLEKEKDTTQEYIDGLLESEQNYVFTNDYGFTA